MLLDDFTYPSPSGFLGSPTPEPEPEIRVTDGGWDQLMQLAAGFPLEALTFGAAINVSPRPSTVRVPAPRAVSYDEVCDLVAGAGDGPFIGLCTGLSLHSR